MLNGFIKLIPINATQNVERGTAVDEKNVNIF